MSRSLGCEYALKTGVPITIHFCLHAMVESMADCRTLTRLSILLKIMSGDVQYPNRPCEVVDRHYNSRQLKLNNSRYSLLEQITLSRLSSHVRLHSGTPKLKHLN